jgi:hypothetical protein
MGKRIDVTGLAEWRAALHKKGSAVNLATRKATTKSAHIVERAVKRELSRYPHSPGTPTPAPPGGPPGLVTGTLRRSERVTPARRHAAGVWSAMAGPTTDYGRAQELGYRPRRLPARPYQKPATRAQLANIRRIYRDAWAEALRA